MRNIKIVLMFFVLLFLISGCERITDTIISPPDTSHTEPLTVMTYNVYLGASAYKPTPSPERLMAKSPQYIASYTRRIKQKPNAFN